MLKHLKRFWSFLKRDTWQSWVISLILMFVIVKFVFFPVMSFLFATNLPLVVVESCSMYHAVDFDTWWEQNSIWYESNKIRLSNFEDYPFRNGLNKGDVILVSGHRAPEKGDVIIFNAQHTYPIIHRVVTEKPLSTKGDNNFGQLQDETNIPEDAFVGRAVARVPGLGWLKLIFFEPFKDKVSRGFC